MTQKDSDKISVIAPEYRTILVEFAEKFSFPKYLGKFNLELAADKTKAIRFSRFETKNSKIAYRWLNRRSQ